MTTLSQRLDELGQLAEKATPGRWTVRVSSGDLPAEMGFSPHVVRVDHDEQHRRRTTYIGEFRSHGANNEADARLVAAFDPTVARALVQVARAAITMQDHAETEPPTSTDGKVWGDWNREDDRLVSEFYVAKAHLSDVLTDTPETT